MSTVSICAKLKSIEIDRHTVDPTSVENRSGSTPMDFTTISKESARHGACRIVLILKKAWRIRFVRKRARGIVRMRLEIDTTKTPAGSRGSRSIGTMTNSFARLRTLSIAPPALATRCRAMFQKFGCSVAKERKLLAKGSTVQYARRARTAGLC